MTAGACTRTRTDTRAQCTHTNTRAHTQVCTHARARATAHEHTHEAHTHAARRATGSHRERAHAPQHMQACTHRCTRARHMHMKHLHRPPQAILCEALWPERCRPHSPLRIPVKQMRLQALGKLLFRRLERRWHIWQLIFGHRRTWWQRLAAPLQRLSCPVNPRRPCRRHGFCLGLRFRLGLGFCIWSLLCRHGCGALHGKVCRRRALRPAWHKWLRSGTCARAWTACAGKQVWHVETKTVRNSEKACVGDGRQAHSSGHMMF